MKPVFKIILWAFSGAFAMMALLFLLVSALSCAMLLCCAVLLNPIFIERIQLKKGLTALLVIGLFIGSVAVFPASTELAAQAVEASQKIVEATPTTKPEETQSLTRDSANVIPLQKVTTVPAETTPAPTPTPTPTPTSTPTPTPTPTNTPKPTATPTPTPATKAVTRSVGITILDYSDSVSRGAYEFIKIQGAPNTDYDCEVEYKSGMSEASGLGVKRSDGNGVASWKWKVGSRTSLDYTPTIYIDGGGDSISMDFEVTK